MLIKQVCQKNVIFATIGILKILVLNMRSIFEMVFMSFNNVAVVYVKGNAYRTHFWYMGRDDAINIMNGSNLVDEKGVL